MAKRATNAENAQDKPSSPKPKRTAIFEKVGVDEESGRSTWSLFGTEKFASVADAGKALAKVKIDGVYMIATVYETAEIREITTHLVMPIEGGI